MTLVLLLSACVSETTGGFSAEGSSALAMERYLQLARGYVEQNDLPAARRHLSNAAAINNNNSDLHGTWALIYTLEGDLGLADDSFRRAIRLDSRNSQVRNNYAAFLFANDRPREAYNQLAVVVEDTGYPARAQAYENMGLAALRLGETANAEAAFMRALQLNGNRVRSILELTDIHLNRGNIAEAATYYERYLTVHEFFNIAHTPRSLWAGIRLEQLRSNEAAMQSYAATLQSMFPDSNEYVRYQQLIERNQ